MKVKDLKKMLDSLPDDHEIVIRKSADLFGGYIDHEPQFITDAFPEGSILIYPGKPIDHSNEEAKQYDSAHVRSQETC